MYGKEISEREAYRRWSLLPARVRDRCLRTWMAISVAWVNGEVLTYRQIAERTHWSKSAVATHLNYLAAIAVVEVAEAMQAKGYKVVWLAFGVKMPDPEQKEPFVRLSGN